MFNPKTQRKMRKTLKTLGLCALAALTIVSCKKTEQTGATMSFEATINQPTSGTRTGINEINGKKWMIWNNGDVIKVFAADGTAAPFTTSEAAPADDREYVDLGLPSGLLWATCNVGADSHEDYGDYFSWAETETKTDYSWVSYTYGTESNLTKYNATDGKTTLEPTDDAAAVNWGNGWRMPTEAEWQELIDNTTHTWTTQGEVAGLLFTAGNGNSLFLPAAGYRYGSGGDYDAVGRQCRYWTSSLPNMEYPQYVRGFICKSAPPLALQRTPM